MSHELLTTLNSIILLSKTILENGKEIKNNLKAFELLKVPLIV